MHKILADEPMKPISVRMILLLGAVLYASFFWRLGTPVLTNAELMGPDDFLRFNQVKAWLEGQAYFDSSVHDFVGSQLHWSRLVDIPIAGLAYLLSFFVDTTTALLVTSLLWPFLLFLVMVYLMVRICDYFAGPHSRLLALFFIGVNGMAKLEFMPGRIDHHSAQIILVLVALIALLTRPAWASGVLLGVAVAFSLAIGSEMILLLGVVLAAFSLAWVLGGEEECERLKWSGVSMIAASIVLFFTTIAPSQWFAAHCDAYSLFYAAALVGIGSCLAALSILTPKIDAYSGDQRQNRLIAGAMFAGALSVMVFTVFPACLAGPIGAIDEELMRRWFVNIGEAQGLLTHLESEPEQWIGILVYVSVMLAVATGVTLHRWRSDPYLLPFFVILLACILYSFVQIRMLRVSMFAAVPFCVAFTMMLSQRYQQSALLRTAAKVSCCIVLTSYIWVITANSIATALEINSDAKHDNGVEAPTASNTPKPRRETACQSRYDYSELVKLPDGLVISDLGSAAPMIVHTSHRVVSGNYHRNADEILAVMDFFQSDPAKSKAIASRYGADYVAACRASGGTPVVTDSDLINRIWRDELPDWLEWVSHPKARLAVLRIKD